VYIDKGGKGIMATKIK